VAAAAVVVVVVVGAVVVGVVVVVVVVVVYADAVIAMVLCIGVILVSCMCLLGFCSSAQGQARCKSVFACGKCEMCVGF
jgi:hypothetical protein